MTALAEVATGPLRIKALTVENFKGLAKLELKPGANLILVKGRNGSGKSSALDAVWWVLDSKRAGKEIKNPVRDGAKRASVVLDLGDIVLKKTQAAGKTAKLTIEGRDGAKRRRPSELLSGMVDSVSLDPMEFSRATPKARLAMLMDVVDLPFNPEELDRRRASAYEERTVVNREVKRAAAVVESLGSAREASPVSVSELLQDHAEAVRRRDKADGLRAALEERRSGLERAEAVLDEAKRALSTAQEEHAAALAAVSKIPEGLIDPAEIKAHIDAAEETNAAARVWEERKSAEERLAELEERAAALTAEIEAVDAEREEGMASATFPVPGLGFTADGVTYSGKPYEDCCTGEQWRCAVGIVMARDPKVHVLRVKDGSLLDDQALATLDEMCEANKWDALVEIVTGGDLDYPGVEIVEAESE